jgi:hypothetical protein
VGLRTFNASFALRNLKVTSGQRRWAADFSGERPEPGASAAAKPAAIDSRQRALESLCLLILNLNELVYID